LVGGFGNGLFSRKSNSEQLREERKKIKEVMITAILFGLTLNLLSNFLYDIPNSLVNPISWFWFGVSLVGTLYFARVLIRQYVGAYSKFDTNFVAYLVWDTEDGKFVRLSPLYQPQIIGRYQFNLLSTKEQAILQSKLQSDPRNISKQDQSILLDLFLDIFRYKLRKGNYFSKNRPHSIRGIGQKKDDVDVSFYSEDVPGQYELRTKRQNSDSAVLELSWSNQYHGQIDIEIKCIGTSRTDYRIILSEHIPDNQRDIVYWEHLRSVFEYPGQEPRDISKYGMVQFEVMMNAEFSPEKLGLGRAKVQESIEWVERFFNLMTLQFGWHHQRFASAQGQQLFDKIRFG
jgi:hypothetical protein